MASALVGILEPSSAAVNNISSATIASSRGIIYQQLSMKEDVIMKLCLKLLLNMTMVKEQLLVL